jgi:uncharacterized protein (DUF2141 family)
MIVWGGVDVAGSEKYYDTGGLYDPASNTWAATSTAGAPSARAYHVGVWTGSRMIVWGGFFEPVTYANTGGTYDPVGDAWGATSSAGVCPARAYHTAVSTGSKMVVWGGLTSAGYLNTGGVYDSATDGWTATSTTGAPSVRREHTAVWTGSKMIVWGGMYSSYLNTGGVYDPVADTWTPTSTAGAPSARHNHTAVWTGSKMIVWGGQSVSGDSNTGGVYDPATDTWTATSTTGAPSARFYHTAVWTGSAMIVWGGGGGGSLATGGVYDPATDTWTATSMTGAPSARLYHTAVWTGSTMIVWGGYGDSYLGTGGVYDPATDTWTATSTTASPAGRIYHTAVWTGTKMIVWGGDNGGALNTGGVYSPATDTWTASSTNGAPSARYYHTAVWAGPKMVVLGGYDGSSFLGAGGLYDPGRYALTVSRGGTGSGSVSSSPAGISCGADCSESYDYDTSVTLTPTAGTGSTFTSWSGDCTGSGACVVTMDAPKSVTATFTLNTYALTVSTDGTGGGSVSSSPAGISCGVDCSESYGHGTVVTLVPSPDAGSAFTSWAGDCAGSGACVVTMDAAKSVTATFTPSEYELAVGTDGSGTGTLTSSPAGIDCGSDCSESFAAGTEVTLMHTAAIGSAFVGWSGDCTGSGACVVTMDAAKSVTATFGLSGGTGFYTVTPCRVVDTRGAEGPALAAGTARSFQVAGVCDIPATAKSVAVNVTAVNETHAGHLRVYPAGSTLPVTSTLNFTPLVTRANNAVIGLSAGGVVSVWCGMQAGSTHFVLDVVGYFQ